MTQDEINQVQAYIGQLTQAHATEIARLKYHYEAAMASEQKARKLAQADSMKMGTAVHTIWDLSRQQPPVPTEVFSTNVRQIINHYCPDFDIPF